jgi:hypothetical protein
VKERCILHHKWGKQCSLEMTGWGNMFFVKAGVCLVKANILVPRSSYA